MKRSQPRTDGPKTGGPNTDESMIGESTTAEPGFFPDPAVDRVLAVTMALATEVYVLRDRLRAMEAAMVSHGVIAADELSAAPGDTERLASAADRDAFVAGLMAALHGETVVDAQKDIRRRQESQ
jgi:hypothetical protein